MIGAEDEIRTRDYSQRILSPWREFSVNRCLYLTIQFLVTEKCPTKLPMGTEEVVIKQKKPSPFASLAILKKVNKK